MKLILTTLGLITISKITAQIVNKQKKKEKKKREAFRITKAAFWAYIAGCAIRVTNNSFSTIVS